MTSRAPEKEKEIDWLARPDILLFGGSEREPDLQTLDNFYVQPFNLSVPYSSEVQPFACIENYFQSAKFWLQEEDFEWAEKVRTAATGKQAQQLGRERRLPADVLKRWREGEATKAMERALKGKFVDSPEAKAAQALLTTGNKTLVEKVEDDPTWDDKLWGAGKEGVGINRMGILLMETRDELRKQASPA